MINSVDIGLGPFAMSSPTQFSGKVRFGEFELDLETAELRSNGSKAIVPGQPFHILVTLLGRPGQLVTREELKKQLWPSDTFVDFDVSLNKAVNRLREVLRDSAEHPRFIETLPRKGYRFIATLSGLPNQATVVAIPERQERGETPTAPYNVVPAKPRSQGTMFGVGGAAVALLAILGYLLRPTLPPPRISGYTQITHDGQQKRFLGQVTDTVLTDGPRLFVQENIHGRFVIAQVPAAGGDSVPMATPFANVTPLNISPDKSELLVGSFTGTEVDQQLWALPVVGGSPRRVSDLLGWDGAWQTNGNFLMARNNELLEISPGGVRKFAALPDYSYWFRWSPDGRLLRFTVSESKGINSLWELSSSGGNLRRVFPELAGASNQNGSWTPDGKYFIFQIFRQNRMDLWAVREKGNLLHKVDHRPVQLTSGPMSFNGVQPSTDGRKIYAVGEQARAELVRYDAKSRQFLPYIEGSSITDVSFSPDAKWLAYVTYPEGVLWRSRVDGSQKLQLTSKVPSSASLPRWSPDGKQIVFSGADPGHPARLYLTSADGGTPRMLSVGEFNALCPTWMPNGNSIVFMDAAGGHSIKVVNTATLQVTVIPDSKDLFMPVTSPDGRYIVGPSVNGRKLLLYDFSSRKWSELLNMNVGSTNWSQDSKYIYFDTGLSENPAIYRLRLADKRLERLADLKGFRRVVSAWLPWSGITPDGAPLLLRDISSQEVYALDFETP